MIYTIIALFSLTVIFGLYLISFVLRNIETPKSAAFIHGLFAFISLVLFFIYATRHRPTFIESLTLFIIAALGGIVLFARDLTGHPVPKWLGVIHGLTAIMGYIFLLVYTFMSK